MVSDTSNRLCGPCNCILENIREVNWHTNLVHHHSLRTLEESANAACGVCTVLLEHLQSSSFQQVSDMWDKLFPIKCESDTSSASWQSSFELTLTSDGVKNLGLKFTFEVIEESVGNQSGYTPSSTTDSPQSWELIGQWLKQCTENHDRCNAPIPELWAPTRLLDIGTPGDKYVRLVERDESLFLKQPYATLSHCWGTTQLTCTTSCNIKRHRHGISWTELPKSFKDAIRIARSLSLRYLWIDSLCIVQDSIDDWLHEADIMSKVYRYGFINIAATGAVQSSEGCFWKRDPRVVQPTEFSIQWNNCEKLESRRYHVVPDPHLWARKLVDEPLNQRGWVLQERILSRRVLHFGHEQLFWECREFVACETYHRGLPFSLRGNTLIDIKTLDLGDEPQDDRWPAKYVSKSVNARGTLLGHVWSTVTELFRPITLQEVTLNSTMKSASVYRDWDAVVELYSLGALSFPHDKLVALSGIASAMSMVEKNAPGDGYLAGLWQSSLPSHLLWTTEKTEKRRQTLIPSRYEQYIAPSWSWASIRGKISLTWCQHNYDPKDYLAALEGAEVTWSDPRARFGQVKSGFLRLSAPLASVLWEAEDSPSLANPMAAKITHIFPRNFDRHMSVSIPPDTSTKAEILFDTVSDDVSDELTLLPVIGIMRRTAHENETMFGLVLQQQAKPECYSRLGVFYTTRLRASKILRNMPRQSVTII
ncbi:HET-domain-containing protein [Mytilinidion resinicola]|uniref:HET-domain-containing protein n=1 Tax=Mytilinidion resinicola TaxID=574789 RepID=A0A6A6YCY3_9PEZI|nr:HET-domain-containing protein [Mytilinidion resinicola]KAF2806681.1 HET-domain-containing protein [Mytilinidion resinicola]